MADTKISALAAASSALAADEVPVNEAGTTKKVTIAQIAALMFVSGVYAPGSFTVPTGGYARMARRLVLVTSDRATLAGTAQLRID